MEWDEDVDSLFSAPDSEEDAHDEDGRLVQADDEDDDLVIMQDVDYFDDEDDGPVIMQDVDYFEEEEEQDQNKHTQELVRTTMEQMNRIGFRATQDALRSQAQDLQLALETAADDYSDKCREFYNTIILKTTQDSIRTTLESIVARKTQQQHRQQGIDNEAEIANIVTAVRVFGDRQDVLAKQINGCHAAFTAARTRYENAKAQLADVTRQLRVVLDEAWRRAGGGNRNRRQNNRRNPRNRRQRQRDEQEMEHDEEYNLRQELSCAIQVLKRRAQKLHKKSQGQLRGLRAEYCQNQPPRPVTV